MSTAPIRLATPADAPACSRIYRPIVEHTATSFEVIAPDANTFVERIHSTMSDYPWLVYELDDVVAYAYAGQHRVRSAYQWSVEVSVYVDEATRGSGVGRRLYEKLFACLQRQGYRNALAGITIPNNASEGFHRAMGFETVGTYPDIGYKLGRWHDVLWLTLKLGEGVAPDAPTPLSSCREHIERILATD